MKNLFCGICVILAFTISCKEKDRDGERKENLESVQKKSEANAPFNKEKETAAIKEVISNETKSFFNRNYEEWKNYWIQKEYSFRAGNGPDSTYAMYGWENISDHVKNFDREHYKGKEGRKFSTPKRKNFTVNFNSETSAYVKWEQYNQVAKENIYYRSQESRLMEKEGGNWKIVNVLAFWDRSEPVDSISVQKSLMNQ